jgi:carbonic anhydrase/acetyltransferase-like protein (isoleucine patch superfamily)
MIKPGVVVGRNSVLGLGSVLTKDIPDNEIWFGNPARKVKEVPEEERVIYGEAKVSKGIADYHEQLNREHPVWPYSIKDMK